MTQWFLSASSGDPILDWLSKAGSLGILSFIIVAFIRGWIVPGRDYDSIRAERDKALDLVYKQAEIAQRALEVGEKKSV